jgi:sec-independent protein translocase protein TatA
MPNIGPLEIVVVLIIALVVFGPKRLPELGKSMGNGIREFRSTISGKDEEPKPELESSTDGDVERVDGEVVGHSAP